MHPEVGFQSLLGRSAAFRQAVELAGKVAASRTTVLLVGQTGTGKELFARGIHNAGPTAGEPFVAVNCAAIPETLLESELFGHERGAFTDARAQKRGLVELAGSGTLFLDEVNELPLSLQPKLLRVLEERRVRRLGGLDELPVRCRVIAASNVPLESAVERGHFREDLFYRLNVFRLVLPRLRERLDDVELLARHFLDRLEHEQGVGPRELGRDAVAALRTHSWPGNIRELKNVVERAAILAERGVVRAEHLMIQRRDGGPPPGGGEEAQIRIPAEGKSLGAIEREAVLLILQLARGNRSAAARMLGISRPTLNRKLARYGIAGARAQGLA